MAEYGERIGGFERKGLMVAAYTEGIEVRQGQRRWSGRYRDLGRLHYQLTQVTLNGRPLPRKYLLQLFLSDGKAYSLVTSDAREGELLSTILATASPILAKRDLATFSAGGELDLGAVRINDRSLRVRKGRWRSLGLDQVAGWVIRAGHLLIDRKRNKPRLWLELPVGQVGNLFSLEAILKQVYPAGDYADAHNVTEARRKASSAPWIRPTAAVRRPGGLTRRGWFFVLAFLPLMFCLYALIALPWALQRDAYASALDEQFEQVTAVGRRIFDGLPADVPAGTQALDQACAGKLRYGSADTLAAYFGPLDQGLMAQFAEYDRAKPHLRVVASNERGYLRAQAVERDVFDGHDLLDSWATMLSEFPGDWGYRIQDYARYHVDLRQARYLMVAKVLGLETDRSHKPRWAKLYAQVVDLPGGQAVCQGQVEFHLTGHERAPYAGPSGLERAAMLPVCAAGGDELCEGLQRD